MLRNFCATAAAFAAIAAIPAHAQQRPELDGLIAKYAAEYNVPQTLIRRVIRRESGGNSGVVYRGNFGLMQIKPATARSMGYGGGARGLLDAETNMRYAVKYLAGAWRLSGGSEARAVHYYAAGYYYAAKRRGLAVPSDGASAVAAGSYAVAARGWAAPPDPNGVNSPASPYFR